MELACALPDLLELSVKKCARTAFTVLTVARCASAGTVPAATTSQDPAYAPPAGQDHTAFWNAQRVILDSSAVRHVSVRMKAGVTTSPGDAVAWPDGLESTVNYPALQDITGKIVLVNVCVNMKALVMTLVVSAPAHQDGLELLVN